MSTDIATRLEQPEYTGENRCWPCTAVNLLLAAALAALVGRRNRALGILTFLAGAALVALRGYLVPGTPELTERYLPDSVLALFGKASRPEPMDDSLTRHAASRAADDGSAETGEVNVERIDVSDPDGTAEDEAEAGDDSAPEVTREDLEDLLDRPMDEVLEAFAVVEEGEDDLVLVDSFREAWEGHIDALTDDGDERRRAFAEIFETDAGTVDVEQREDGRYYGVVDGRAECNWITEAAMLSDLAAERALEDDRWALLESEERLSILRGFRVFLTTCPECGGPISATDEVVESCCGSWDVIAVECADCGVRVLELAAPEDATGQEAEPADPQKGGFTR